jgi:hypothetical protein
VLFASFPEDDEIAASFIPMKSRFSKYREQKKKAADELPNDTNETQTRKRARREIS